MCKNLCDSLHYIYKGGDIKTISTYYRGSLNGPFIEFNEGDTIFGNNSTFMNMLKKTRIVNDSITVVEIYKKGNNDLNLSERVVYNDDSIWLGESHFVDIRKSGNNVYTRLKLLGEYDSVSLYLENEKQWSKKYNYNDSMYLFEYDINDTEEAKSLYVFEFISDTINDEHYTQGFFFNISSKRLDDDFLQPDEVKRLY